MAAGRPAPEVGNVAVATVAESSTTQPTTRSTIRETETGDQPRKRRLRVLASRPDQIGADVNACTCMTSVLAAGPEDRDGWTQQVVDWNKKRFEAKSRHLGHLFESQKVSEDRIKELANVEKLEVAEITLQEDGAQDRRSSTSGGWTMREERRKILMQPGAEWMRHRSTHTTVKMWCRRHYQSKRPVSF